MVRDVTAAPQDVTVWRSAAIAGAAGAGAAAVAATAGTHKTKGRPLGLGLLPLLVVQ